MAVSSVSVAAFTLIVTSTDDDCNRRRRRREDAAMETRETEPGRPSRLRYSTTASRNALLVAVVKNETVIPPTPMTV